MSKYLLVAQQIALGKFLSNSVDEAGGYVLSAASRLAYDAAVGPAAALP